MTARDCVLASCEQKPARHIPVWLMRQAGRYLPEYRRLKEKHSFLEMVKTPELATEVTLQPLRRFDFDAAIIFSDILVIPEALGQPYHFRESGGIEMPYSLDSEEKINALDHSYITEKLSYVGEALQLVKKEIKNERTLLGFAGSPWTLATYMVEGGSSITFSKIKNLPHQHPDAFQNLMEKLTKALVEYFQLQINSGADALQIFDSWGAICPNEHYWDWSLQWIKKIIQEVGTQVPIILFAKGMAHQIDNLLKTGAQVLSIDSSVQLSHIKSQTHGKCALQGNLDPAILNTDPQTVTKATEKILSSLPSHTGYIFNLGHGILPQAKLENVEALIQTVHQHKVLP